jgi:hypothetical protein
MAVAAVWLALAPAVTYAQAPAPQITILPDAEKWVEAAVQELINGKVEEFSRTYAQMIGQPQTTEVLLRRLGVIKTLGQPVFYEKVLDQRYGTSLRQVVYLALYRQTDYAYFKFTIKKNRGGWVVSRFDFRMEGVRCSPRISWCRPSERGLPYSSLRRLPGIGVSHSSML